MFSFPTLKSARSLWHICEIPMIMRDLCIFIHKNCENPHNEQLIYDHRSLAEVVLISEFDMLTCWMFFAVNEGNLQLDNRGCVDLTQQHVQPGVGSDPQGSRSKSQGRGQCQFTGRGQASSERSRSISDILHANLKPIIEIFYFSINKPLI